MTEYPESDSEQSFLEHLVELRSRLIRACLSILVVLVCLLPFARNLYETVAAPLMAKLPEGSSMIAIDVASPFLTPFKLTLLVSIMVAMPYILFQLWAFVAPALFKHEKRLARPLLYSSIVLFYLGCAFAYFVVFPLVFGFLTSIAPEGVEVMTDISKYLDFVTTLFLAFGITFEVPIATIILVATGITTPEKLSAMRPYIVVGAFALGMLLTPPDVISQTLMAIPMWFLFEVGIIFSRLLLKDKEETQAIS
ncbi:MAG: sec-independent protein translocase protein TatC [Lysobacterales bacterium]|jgi:sec-independent protein translocase protein TatC